jgi:AraC-like DNA-binding protein
MRSSTIGERRRLYLLARAIVARHYRRALTVEAVARALSSSPRQLQRAYMQFGGSTFQEDLAARRMAAALELLAGQSIPVRDVARLVGYSHHSHFARAFRQRYGLAPARFRERSRERRRVADGVALDPTAARGTAAPRPADQSALEYGAASARSSSTASAPGRRTRIAVPPPGSVSAEIEPPCCSTT